MSIVWSIAPFCQPRSIMHRVIEPHALVFDGFRWHVRGCDVGADRFKDFVLARLSSLELGGVAASSAADDLDWQTRESLIIEPNPKLSLAQRELIQADYGMLGGRLELTPRRAESYYMKARLGLTAGHQQRPARDQHIVLRSDPGQCGPAAAPTAY